MCAINTLLGSPRELICQCCGMPLADDSISREKDGFLNEDYCKWCYADGVHLYSDMEDLIEVCVKNMPRTRTQRRSARLSAAAAASARSIGKGQEKNKDIKKDFAHPSR